MSGMMGRLNAGPSLSVSNGPNLNRKGRRFRIEDRGLDLTPPTRGCAAVHHA
jgi:hypothetical protein